MNRLLRITLGTILIALAPVILWAAEHFLFAALSLLSGFAFLDQGGSSHGSGYDHW